MFCSDIWHKYHEWYFKIVIRNFTSRLGEWNLRQFWNITSGIYIKYQVQIMLLFVYNTTCKRFVIVTCKYFKLSWNTSSLSQSSCRNFSCSSIILRNKISGIHKKGRTLGIVWVMTKILQHVNENPLYNYKQSKASYKAKCTDSEIFGSVLSIKLNGIKNFVQIISFGFDQLTHPATVILKPHGTHLCYGYLQRVSGIRFICTSSWSTFTLMFCVLINQNKLFWWLDILLIKHKTWFVRTSSPRISRQRSFPVPCHYPGIKIKFKKQENSFPVKFSALGVNLQKFTSIFPLRF